MKMPRVVGKRGRERGSILITAIMVIVVMVLIAIPFLFRLSGASRSTERSARALAAFELAEAGVEKVMWFLNPKSGPSGIDPEAIQWDLANPTQGVIHNLKSADNTVMGDVHVVLTPPVGAALDTRTLTSTGMVRFIADNTVNRTVRVTLMKGVKGAFDYGFFANQYFYIQNGFYLDAYDSRDGAYGATTSDGTTNARSPDVYFGSNTYMDANNPNNPGEATWVIDQGGGSNQVYGTVQAGGYDAEASNNGTGDPPDPDILNDVINVPHSMDPVDSQIMKQEFQLPPVDVYNLPPKNNLTSLIPSSLGNWFNNYNPTNPELSSGYYGNQLTRAPYASELQSGYIKGSFSGSGTLTEANSGFYTSFMVGGYATPGTVTIPSGNHVVIYVSSYGDAAKAGSFYMGTNSSINIAPDASLTLILGKTSVTVEQGYNIHAQGTPPIPGNCVILGTNQFDIPPDAKLPLQSGTKATDVDKMAIPGFMFFEHAQSDGNIYAAMYAPHAVMADLQGQNHMNWYGSAIVEAMCFKVQVSFHYDKALADLSIIDAGFEYWAIVNWTEVIGAGI